MRKKIDSGRGRIELVRAAVQAALSDARSRHAERACTPARLLRLGAGPLALTALLAALPAKTFATDYTRNGNPGGFWSTNSGQWSPAGIPGGSDRVIFTDTSGTALRVDLSGIDVGQLVWTTTAANTIWTGIPLLPPAPRLFVHGIGGVGLDVQGTATASVFNAIGIVGNQTWQATNAAGGGFATIGGSNQGLLDLGSYTLTVDLVNAVNTGQLFKLTGTGNLVKTGLGTLTLSGTSSSYVPSTFTGSTSIDAGTLALAGYGAIPTSSRVTVNSGATFDVSAITPASTSIKTLAGSGNVALGAKTLTITAGNDTFSGVISGSGGGLAVTGGTQILSGANTYAGGTTLNGGVLSVAADNALGDAAGALTFNGGTLRNTAAFTSARVINDPGTGTFQTDADLTLSGSISGTTLTKTGEATLTRTGTGAPASWNLLGGTLSVSSVGQMGALNTFFGGGTLQVTAPVTYARGTTLNAGGGTFRTDADLILTNNVQGTGSLTKTGPATLTLASSLGTWSGGTTISEGTLQIGNGGVTGVLTGNVLNNATLAFNKTSALTVGGLISGSGVVIQRGTGTTTLAGNNTYTGATNVNVGTLRVNGNQSAATGLVSVASGATLGGNGTIGGAVTVADGGHLAPGNSPGTLTMGTLSLSSGSILDFELGQANTAGGTLNDLINVNGDLTLDGTLNVALSAGGTYGAGIYRLINYTGTLTDNGLDLGLTPASSANYVQTSVASQVNLINSQGLALNYWDGAANLRNNSQIGGGNGVWQAAGNDNWTLAEGSINARYQSGSMAVFAGNAGTVSVDDSLGAINVSGLQFASNGYRLEGDAITLGAGLNTMRVGDGTDAGAEYAATIASALTGSGTLDKSDLGTLVLTGANSYTGGTSISAGTLQLGDGGTSGSLAGDVTNNGALVFNRSDAFAFAGVISGGGELRQIGSGTTTLSGAGSTVGTLNVQSGTLEVASGASLAANTTVVATGATLRNGGTFTGSAGDDMLTLAGTLIGSASFLDGNDQVQIAEGANFSQAAFEGGAGIDTLDLTSSSALTLAPALATGFENLVKRGTGALTLSGNIDGFSDSVTLASGTAHLANANVLTNQLNIDSGVTVTGTGSLSGSLANAGVLSPGNSPGALHVGGNYTQAGSGTLVSEILRTGTDLLDIAGSATLAGTHQIQVQYGLYLNGTTQTVLHAAGGINRDYDSVQINPSALMPATRQLTANAETLSFLRQPFTSITDPQSGKGRFAQWLEDNISGGKLTATMTEYIDEVLQQPTAAEAEVLLGERGAPPATTAVAQNSVSILGAEFAHNIFGRFQLTDQAECIEMQTASNETPQCFWAHAPRQWGHADGDEFGPRTDWTTDGLQIGVDRSLSESWKAGISFGYAESEIHDPTGGRNDLRARMIGLYTQYEAGQLGIGALGFYSDNDNSTRRTVVVDDTPRQALADFATNSYGVGTRVGYRFGGAAGPSLRPFIEAFYNRLQAAHFGEGNAGAGNLSGNIRGREDIRGTAGVQLAQSFETHRLVLRPMIELGVSHEFRDVRSTVDLQPFSDSGAFRTYGPALDRNSYMARASLDVAVARNAAITLGYGGEIAGNYSQHEGSLSFRVAW